MGRNPHRILPSASPFSGQCLAVSQRHPLRGLGGQLARMALQLGQVFEGAAAAQLAGLDQAHERVAHLPAR